MRIGRRRTLCLERRGWCPSPWKSTDDLEIAVAECVDWFDHRRLHGQIGLIPVNDRDQPVPVRYG